MALNTGAKLGGLKTIFRRGNLQQSPQSCARENAAQLLHILAEMNYSPVLKGSLIVNARQNTQGRKNCDTHTNDNVNNYKNGRIAFILSIHSPRVPSRFFLVVNHLSDITKNYNLYQNDITRNAV